MQANAGRWLNDERFCVGGPMPPGANEAAGKSRADATEARCTGAACNSVRVGALKIRCGAAWSGLFPTDIVSELPGRLPLARGRVSLFTSGSEARVCKESSFLKTEAFIRSDFIVSFCGFIGITAGGVPCLTRTRCARVMRQVGFLRPARNSASGKATSLLGSDARRRRKSELISAKTKFFTFTNSGPAAHHVVKANAL